MICDRNLPSRSSIWNRSWSTHRQVADPEKFVRQLKSLSLYSTSLVKHATSFHPSGILLLIRLLALHPFVIDCYDHVTGDWFCLIWIKARSFASWNRFCTKCCKRFALVWFTSVTVTFLKCYFCFICANCWKSCSSILVV